MIRQLVGLLVAASLASCGVEGPVAPASAVQATAESDYRLGTGDKLRISLYGDESFGGEFEVGSDGAISLPLIGAVPAAGLTEAELRTRIEQKLADGYYRTPRITAEVIEFRPFYILGEVNRPGVYPYVSNLTLAQAVATAGGYTYRANSRVVAIKRAREEQEVRVQSDQALRIQPGDTIRVLERRF
ncbi:MAG TPA: polysaccharide biosynthesis/export family protein [Allosphingosinicella sp.]|jgi:polysaccharide export outer membrane protein